jgi:4-methyl-5(b-hydroxyethyl)-thiazole monophosphate biosynthesis
MVHLFLANGFEEIEALATLDILRRANIEVNTVSISGARMVKGAHGISVKADAIFRKGETEMSDCIILPGGMPGAENLRMHEGLRRTLKVQSKRGGYIAAICASPSIFGRRGILNGRDATAYPGFEDELKGATVVDAGAVRNGHVITGRSMGSAIEFGLLLVETLLGQEKAEEIAKQIVYL